jgi:3-hydroxybutyryl-CoA dehydratase
LNEKTARRSPGAPFFHLDFLQPQSNKVANHDTNVDFYYLADKIMLDNMPRGTICIEDLEIGMTRTLRKTVSDADIEMFAQVSTDFNPVHMDDDYAQDTIFEGRIAHGMLTAGLISAVIGEQLPGHGTVYLGQTLKFMAPVRPGDQVYVEVEVLTIDYAKRRVTMRTECFVYGKSVLKGDATVLAPSRKFD